MTPHSHASSNLTSHTFGDDSLRIDIEAHERGVTLTWTDRRTGYTLGPTPMLELELHEKPIRRNLRVPDYTVHRLEPAENGAHVVVGDTQRQIVAGLWVHVIDGELVVRVPIPEVYERLDGVWRLFAVDILPELMSVDAAGTLMLPVGCGALCRPADKPALRDDMLLYMEQPRWDIASILPLCAAWDDDHGIIAMATDGDCDTRCSVETDGRGHGRTGFAVTLRRVWHDPVDTQTRELRYRPAQLDAVMDVPHQAGHRLRRFMIDRRGMRPLADRRRDNPAIDYVLQSHIMKMSFAQENVGWEMMSKDKSDPVTYHLEMTFAEAESALRRLREAGIEKVQTFACGWNARGHDGLYPTRFPIDERLGGEAGFRKLIAAGNEMGYHMSVHDNFMMNNLASPDFDPEYCTHDMYGEPLLHGWWSGGLEYQTWGLALPEDRLEGHLRRMKSLGIRGVYYCDYMMQPPEVNYHPKHAGPRAACVEGQKRIWRACREVFGAVGTEFAPLPASEHCDFICHATGKPLLPQWPIAQLVDERIDLWPIVFHGLTVKEQITRDWKGVQQALLEGATPRSNDWTLRPAKGQSIFNDAFLEHTRHVDTLLCQRFPHLRDRFIERFERIGEDAWRSEFADGTVIEADYGSGELRANGESIPRFPELA